MIEENNQETNAQPDALNTENNALSFELQTANPDMEFVNSITNKIRNEIQQVIIGQDELIEKMIVALFSGGHVLLEGVPGVAKTLIVKLLAKTLKVDFKRIQFTPDLMPSDVIGTTVFNMKTSDFYFRPGPVFSNFILVDEINRSPAKTQAALFEVMEEHQITVDGECRKLNFPLFIVATQNPIEQEGTYKLPEAQLDRFLFKLIVKYPDFKEEINILHRFKNDFEGKIAEDVKPVFTVEDLKRCMDIIEKVHIKDELLEYIAKIVQETRNSSDLYLGASPRASLAIMKTAKAIAAINLRDFVIPDDIKSIAFSVLNHRIILNPEKEIEGVELQDVINSIIHKIEVPR
ncbi:MAG: MoxR family ATPase [Bacteroidetes bacterium]|nr:MoxR family ATPase [Bacteroidota bacterium]